MAIENNTEGFSSLDDLGSSFGGINDSISSAEDIKPFEGDKIQMDSINFPKADSFQSVIPQFDSLNNEQLNIRRNVVGSPTTPKAKPNQVSKADLVHGLNSYLGAQLASNQDKSDYARITQFDSGSKGNSFYKRYMAYGQEKFDEVGFTPMRDNEATFNAATTGWDDFKRMFNYSFIPLAAHGFIAGPKSLIQAAQGDFGADLEEARAYEDATAIGYSSKGGLGSFMNNAFMNFGYTAGIITEVLAEEAILGAITAGSLGGAAPVAAVRTASNMARIGKGFASAFYLDRAANVVGKAITSLKSTSAARNFWKAANTPVGRFFNPLTNTFEAVSNISKISKFDNISSLAKISKTTGGFYADVRRLNAAFSEGRLEGGLVQNSIYDKLYNESFDITGKAPSDSEQESMMQTAKDAASETIGWNTALVYLSNGITFNNIFTPKGGMRKFLAGQTSELIKTAEGRVVAEVTQKAGSKALKAEAKYIENSLKESVKAFKAAPIRTTLKGIGTYTKANVAEGLQENAQETLSQGLESYYTDMFKSEAVNGHLFGRATTTLGMRNKFSYLSDAWGDQNPLTAKGFETFATGFVMGIFGGGLNLVPGFVSKSYNKLYKTEQYDEYLKGKHEYGEGLAKTLNDNLFNDPQKLFDSRLFNLAIQDKAGKAKKTGSQQQVIDLNDEALVASVITAINTGAFDVFKQQIGSYKDLSAEEFEDAAKLEKGTAANYQGKIDSILQRMDEIQSDHKENTDRYPDPIDLSGYKKGTDAYNKAAIYLSAWKAGRDNAVFLGQTFKNAQTQIADIEKNLKSKKPLSKMTDAQLMTILDPSRLPSEIGILESEIEAGKDTLDKRELTKKQRVLDSLKEFKKKVDYYERYDNAELEAKIEKLKSQGKFKDVVDDEGNKLSEEDAEATTRDYIRKRLNVRSKTDQNTTRAESDLEVAYKEYLKAIADVSNDSYLDRSADEAFESIMDRYRLGRDAKTLNGYVNLLYNPNEFMEHIERNYAWMSRLYENRKDYYDALVKQELGNIEMNALLNALADKAVYISAEDAFTFKKSGIIPAEFYDDARKIVIREGSLEYDNYAFLFRQANRLKAMDPKSKTNTNERLVLELQALSMQEQQELSALPMIDKLTQKADLDLKGNKTVKLTDVVDQLADGDTLSAFYIENGQPVEIVYYMDGKVLKLEDKTGAIVEVATTMIDIIDGKISAITQTPEDPIAAQKIRNEYSKKREDAIRRSIEDVKNATVTTEAEFVPSTVNTPFEEMDKALQIKLQQEFNAYVEEAGLLDEYAQFDDVAMMDALTEFIQENPRAKKVVNEYNGQQLSIQLENNASRINAPIIMYNGQEIDMAVTSLETAKEILADLEKQLAGRETENLSNEESEDLLIEQFNIELLKRYISDVEILSTEEKTSGKKINTDIDALAAETKKRRLLAEKALQKKIDLVEQNRLLAEKEEAEITDTLDYLTQLLDNTVELTGVQIEDLINKIAQLDKTTAQLVKPNQKKRAGKINDRTDSYKLQLRREFALTNDIANRIRDLKQQRDQLTAIKNDLKKQADYYRNLLVSPNFDLFDKTAIRNKIKSIEKKIGTIQKLIDILRDAIKRSVAYLKEYLKIWQTNDTALSKIKNSGYKELSDYTLTQLRGTGDVRLDEYIQSKAELQRLEREINQSMDDVDFIDEVREQENKRMLELEAAIQKYQDQVRYLYDLLGPVVEEIVEEPLSSGKNNGPVPTESRTVYDVDPIPEAEEKVTILSTFSLSDIADLDTPLTAEKVGRELTPQEKKLEAVRNIIKEVVKNASFIKLTPDNRGYINTKNNNIYQRVTSYTKESDIKDQIEPNETIADYRKRLVSLTYTDADINQKLKLASSQILGNKVDLVVRDFFDGKIKAASTYDFAPEDQVQAFIDKLQEIKTNLDARGEIVLANDIVLYNDEIGVAGTVDLLTFDVNGDVRIYDIKTMAGNMFNTTYNNDTVVKYESKKFGGKSKRQQHTEQLSLYRILLNNTHGLKAKTLAILPIALEYGPGDTSASAVELLEGLKIIPQDVVRSATLVEGATSAETAQETAPVIKVATDIQKELRDMLNQMGYSNTTIDRLPKSEIEVIVKQGIAKETYVNRVAIDVISDENGNVWALPGEPVLIEKIEQKGVTVTKINGKSGTFISFQQLNKLTSMSDSIKTVTPAQTVITPETSQVLQESSDLVKEVLDKELNNLDGMVKDKTVEVLDNDLFNSKIC